MKRLVRLTCGHWFKLEPAWAERPRTWVWCGSCRTWVVNFTLR